MIRQPWTLVSNALWRFTCARATGANHHSSHCLFAPRGETHAGADERDQYKAYGKTFRKMIAECLQKEPSKRPTASELLKHPFFKKSKDRKYLTQTLLASGPSMETRVNKASKRQPGASGRLHRTITGEWVWSSEEEDNNGHSSDSEQEENRPMNRLIKVESSDSETEDQSELTIASSGAPMQASSEVPPINLVSTVCGAVCACMRACVQCAIAHKSHGCTHTSGIVLLFRGGLIVCSFGCITISRRTYWKAGGAEHFVLLSSY